MSRSHGSSRHRLLSVSSASSPALGPVCAFTLQLGLGLSVAACGGDKDAESVAPVHDFSPAAPTNVPADPNPIGNPASPLPIANFNADWSPPMLTSGDYDGLSRALNSYSAMGLVLGPGVRGMSWDQRANDLVKSYNPNAEIVIRNPNTLDLILKERGDRPIARRAVPDGGRNIFGHPTYVLEDVQLKTTWLDKESKIIGADAFVVLARTEESNEEEPIYQVGSCDGLMQQVAQAKQSSSAYFNEFEAHANQRLALHYASVLSAELPGLRAELRSYEKQRSRTDFKTEREWQGYECGRAYLEWLDGFEPCMTPQGLGCESSPRMVLGSQVGVGVREPRSYVPDRCDKLSDRDYIATLREIAHVAADSAAAELGLAWGEMASRRGVLSEIEEEMGRVCHPKQRRLPEAAIREAQMRMQDVARMLAEPPPSGAAGAWERAGYATHSSDAGGVYLALRHAPSPDSAAGRARETLKSMVEFINKETRCESRARGERVYVMVADVKRGSAAFYGKFLAEELFCVE